MSDDDQITSREFDLYRKYADEKISSLESEMKDGFDSASTRLDEISKQLMDIQITLNNKAAEERSRIAVNSKWMAGIGAIAGLVAGILVDVVKHFIGI